ncbi:PhoH family protein [Gammaproteobacteria bacterium AS21]
MTMTQQRNKRKDAKKAKRRNKLAHLTLINDDLISSSLLGSNSGIGNTEHIAASQIEYIQDFQVRRNTAPIEPRTLSQQQYLQSIDEHQLTFATGPAGTGKTWVCAAMAAQALINKEVKKIVITRPVVEAEENMGFLPGTIEEKFAPYFTPFREVLEERLGTGHVKALLKAGLIEMAPLAYMRGRSFKECFVVLDEAQNTSEGQMKLFLTRIGENSIVVINGDMTQQDIGGQSGLLDAVSRFSHLDSVGYVKFATTDIVRSGLVQQIVQGYSQPKNRDEPPYQAAVRCA